MSRILSSVLAAVLPLKLEAFLPKNPTQKRVVLNKIYIDWDCVITKILYEVLHLYTVESFFFLVTVMSEDENWSVQERI